MNTLRMTEREKLAMVVGAAGRHNMLFLGSPVCGRSLLLEKLRELLPPLTEEEAESVNRIKSLAGLMWESCNWLEVPFRQPHMTASIEGMCGGGPNCRPGEISLAHNGVLFLDEAAEFKVPVLQMLRVPLETGKISLSRAGRASVYPADFQLLMATNPCPCGHYGSRDKICLCSLRSVELYWKKFSAPLLDRMEIVLNVENENDEDRKDYDIEELKAEVKKAVERQRKFGKRYARLDETDLAKWEVSTKAKALLQTLIEHNDWSPRRKRNVLRVAATIASLETNRRFIDDKTLEKAVSLLDNTPATML